MSAFLRVVWLVLRKDLTVEVRSLEIVSTTLFFAVSCVLFFAVAALLWMLIPFWEIKRRSDSGPRPMTVVGIAAVTFVIVMTVWGYLL